MEFTKVYRHQELAAIAKLLSVFGIVEERQLRKLFVHLKDKEYGRLLSAIKREGFVSFFSEGRYIAAPNFIPEPAKSRDSILVFWCFIHFRSRIEDFCGSDPPTLLTFSSEDKECDLIPGTPANVAAINAQADQINSEVRRFIVTRTKDDVSGVELRPSNDYLVFVDDEGNCTLFKT